MTKSITKTDLIRRIADETGQARSTVGNFLDALETAAKEAISDGYVVTIPGLVKLSIRDRAARMGRNPRTGAMMPIAAKRSVTAKVLPSFKA